MAATTWKRDAATAAIVVLLLFAEFQFVVVVHIDQRRVSATHGWPFRIARGRMRFVEPSTSEGDELDQMRDAMGALDATLTRVSGSTLVDHYYTDAYAGFSERMRRLGGELGLRS